MPGPMPKNPVLRQRRNRAATRAKLTEARPPRRRAPRLPKRPPEKPWHDMTRSWWREIWASPMVPEFLHSDIHGLYVLAELVDQFWYDPSTKLAGEIRLQRQCFGLTPIDRRRLQWEIDRGEEADTRRRQRRVRGAHAGDVDPAEALEVLK